MRAIPIKIAIVMVYVINEVECNKKKNGTCPVS